MPEETAKPAKAAKTKTAKTETVEMKLEKICGGSVRYSIENADKTLAVDNVYVYKKSSILKDGKVPDSIRVTIEAV